MDTDYLTRNNFFWSRVDIAGPDDCWLWKLSTGSHGYGQTWDGITNRLAHRAAWTLTHGPIGDGLTIDHLCRERRCQNPKHLRLISNVENARDNGHWTKTHCKWGHEYDPANTYIDSKGHRRCRQCARDRK